MFLLLNKGGNDDARRRVIALVLPYHRVEVHLLVGGEKSKASITWPHPRRARTSVPPLIFFLPGLPYVVAMQGL
jgi:hypothetical protein